MFKRATTEEYEHSKKRRTLEWQIRVLTSDIAAMQALKQRDPEGFSDHMRERLADWQNELQQRRAQLTALITGRCPERVRLPIRPTCAENDPLSAGYDPNFDATAPGIEHKGVTSDMTRGWRPHPGAQTEHMLGASGPCGATGAASGPCGATSASGATGALWPPSQPMQRFGSSGTLTGADLEEFDRMRLARSHERNPLISEAFTAKHLKPSEKPAWPCRGLGDGFVQVGDHDPEPL